MLQITEGGSSSMELMNQEGITMTAISKIPNEGKKEANAGPVKKG